MMSMVLTKSIKYRVLKFIPIDWKLLLSQDIPHSVPCKSVFEQILNQSHLDINDLKRFGRLDAEFIQVEIIL